MKRTLCAAAAALLLAALLCSCSLSNPGQPVRLSPDFTTPEPAPTLPPSPMPTPEPTPEPTPTPTPEPTPTPYVSPIDFDALRERNPHIYAWLQIDGTNIDYPVLQHPEDYSFYLDHDSDGNWSQNGAIFSEAECNGTDFTDPVTVLYGHHMRSGEIFGNLEHYFTDADFFDAGPVLRIYLPDRMLEWPVAAAVPYVSDHILLDRDFTDPQVFSEFFDDLMASDSPWARTVPELAPQPGDRVLILATCYYHGDGERFLVVGVLPGEDGASPEPTAVPAP